MQEPQEVRSLGWEDSPREGNGNPLQHSCLDNGFCCWKYISAVSVHILLYFQSEVACCVTSVLWCVQKKLLLFTLFRFFLLQVWQWLLSSSFACQGWDQKSHFLNLKPIFKFVYKSKDSNFSFLTTLCGFQDLGYRTRDWICREFSSHKFIQ